MEESIFTKIARGEIPSHKVYEDDYCMAIMDIYPVQEGMIVIFIKKQIDNFEDMPEDIRNHFMTAVTKIMKALRLTFPDKKKIAVQIEGLQVAHAHAKLFPINTGEDFRAKPSTAEPDHATLAALAEKIKGNIPQ